MLKQAQEGFRRLNQRSILDRLGFTIDVAMIILVIANLSLIVFDWLFAASPINEFLAYFLPAFHGFYDQHIHQDFISYDLIFVAIYLTEFFIRWGVAIARKTHHRWFFFPFVHWYDVLGCIPVGSFRWLRVLRIITLLHRMQRMEIIDLTNTYLGRTFNKYYSIIVEEISDRVVINVLQGAKREIADGSPLLHRIDSKVIQPRKSYFIDAVAEKIIDASNNTHAIYRQQLGHYLSELVDRSLTNTKQGSRLASIPIAGNRVRLRIAHTVEEISTVLLDQLIEDLNDPKSRPVIEKIILDIIEQVSPEGEELNTFIQQSLQEVLDEVITQVSIKRWKEQFEDD
ncbi:MAG TPA: ion transporter [Alcanivoracaceae bacterium]|nr:ion transporter [Alcanivoracaceae bacterium]